MPEEKTVYAPTARGEARRQAIIEAATELFLEHGFGRTTLDMIIERAGGSRRTIYDLFGGKEGLFAAVMGGRCQSLVERLEELDVERRPLPAALWEIASAFLDMLLSPTSLALYRVLVAETVTFPELGVAFFNAGPEATCQRLQNYLQQQVDSGRLEIADTRLAAVSFLGMVKSDLQLQALFDPESMPGREEIDRRLHACVDGFLRGCGYRDVSAVAYSIR